MSVDALKVGKDTIGRDSPLPCRSGELREMILRDNFGQFTLLVFSEINFNPNLASELFQFDPPSGADVISD